MTTLISKAWVLASGLCLLVQTAESTPVRSTVSCAYETNAEAHICTSDSFYFNHSWLKNEGTYDATFQDQNGCDSIVHLALWYMPNSYGERIMYLCEGQSIDLGGYVISGAGTYQLHYKASWGCDSVVLVHVQGLPSVTTSIKKSLCEGDSLFFGTKWIRENGVYQSSFARSGACDSVVTLTLDIIQTRSPIIKETEGLYAAIPADAYQWLICPEYFPVPNATEARLNIAGEGNYSLRVENKGCIDTLDCTYFKRNTTGIETGSDVEISIYPNPVSETLHIRGNFSSTVHIEVVNMLGQTVIEDFVQPEYILLIGMDGLIKGKYIIRISEKNQLITQSIVVVR
ncbi:MAG: T9SS type A sorting domain-containing protein [Bacteroidia bacterium]